MRNRKPLTDACGHVLCNVLALGGLQVLVHALVVWERGACRANFGAHVANGGHTRAGDGVDTLAKVLNDGTRATLDRQNVRQLNRVNKGNPSVQGKGQRRSREIEETTP